MSADLFARFWSKVDLTPTGCWMWTGTRIKSGYGTFSRFRDGKNWRAHRVAYTLYIGEIPDGIYVLHACDNPPCVNPDHLFLGTQFENMRDCASKGRLNSVNSRKTECPKGHPYDEKNTHIERVKGGRQRRRCKTCLRAAERRRRAA